MLIGPPWLHNYQHLAPFLLASRLVTSTTRSRVEGGVAPCKQSTSRWRPVDANLLACGLDHRCSFRVGCATVCIPCSYYWCTCCVLFSMYSTTPGVVLIPADCATPSIPCSRAVSILASRGCGIIFQWPVHLRLTGGWRLFWQSALAPCVPAGALHSWNGRRILQSWSVVLNTPTPPLGTDHLEHPFFARWATWRAFSVTNGRPCRSGHAFVVDSVADGSQVPQSAGPAHHRDPVRRSPVIVLRGCPVALQTLAVTTVWHLPPSRETRAPVHSTLGPRL